MAITSYGSITIVDITDVGEFSVYPQANAPQTQIYNPDSTGNTAFTPNWHDAHVTISPKAYYAGENVTNSCTYVWKSIIDGVSTTLTTEDGVAQDTRSLVISSNVLGSIASGLITYEVTASYTYQAGLSPLSATGRIDFALVRQGSSAKTIKITGDNLFKYDKDSVLSSTDPIILTGTYSNLTIDGWYYKKVTSNVITWESYPTTHNGTNTRGTDSNSNPTLSIYSEQQVSGADIFINDVLTVKFKGHDINNTEYADVYTITKLRDGAPGTQTKSAILTNEDQMIPSAADGSVTPTALSGAVTRLRIYDGGDEVDYNDWTITITNTSGLTIEKSVDGQTWSSASNDHYTWVKVTGMTADTGNVNFSATDGDVTLTKQFSLLKVKAGEDGKTPIIYSLESDTAAINRAAGTNGAYTPGTVTFNAYQQYVDENDVVHKDPFNGHIVIYKHATSTDSQYKIDETSSNTYTLSKTLASNANYTVLRGVLYTDNNLTTQLDSQSIIITTDGDKGDDGKNGFGAINIILKNEAEVIPCNSAYASTGNPYSIDIPYEAYQGTAAIAVVVKTAGNFATGITPNTSTAGHITYSIPQGTILNSSGGSIQLTFTVTAQDYDSNGNVVTVQRDIDKVFTWAPSKAGGDGKNAMVLTISAPNTVFEKNPDSSTNALTATAILYNGNVAQTSDVSYAWHKYANGNYNTEIIATSGTSATAWKSTTTVTNDTLNIKPGEIDGYASFRVTASYTPSGESTKTFYQYVVFIDKSDPIQISVHSTVGLQIVNSQGVGAIYARVTQDGQAIDAVVDGIEAGVSYPSSPTNGDFFVKLDDTSVALTSRKARLMQYDGSSWNEVGATCQYEWTFRNESNEPITSNVPYQDIDKTKNQFLYINSGLINNKITADVKVTKN